MAHASGEIEFFQGSDGIKRRVDYGSLANRPFGEETGVVFGPESVTFTEAGNSSAGATIIAGQIAELDSASSVVLTLDGTNYEADLYGRNSNVSYFEGTDGFTLTKNMFSSTVIELPSIDVGEHEVSITATVMNRLDAKYLPDTVFETGFVPVETLYDGAPTSVDGSVDATTARIQQSDDSLFQSLSQHADNGGYIRTTVVAQNYGAEATIVLTGKAVDGHVTGESETLGIPMDVSWWYTQMEDVPPYGVGVVLSMPDVTVTNVKIEAVEPHRLNAYNLPAYAVDAIDTLEASKADSIWYDGNRVDVVTALNAICDAAGLQISFSDSQSNGEVPVI